ncbi:leucyl aminopeptidase [Candidatus Marinamargulisbacteria bacterium SCGC AG-414-C22]|nr:leucyl aminopeptidase [Candidatus Marinamargulisbacteria bacterium SCGC AG-414-C22]
MEFSTKKQFFSTYKADLCVIFYTNIADLKNYCKNSFIKQTLATLVKNSELTEEKGSSCLVHTFSKTGPQRVKFVCLGASLSTLDELRHQSGKLARFCTPFPATHVSISCTGIDALSDKDIISSLVEGFILGAYTFSQFKTAQKKVTKTKHITLLLSQEKKVFQSLIQTAIIKANAQNQARTLGNIPANELTTTEFVDTCKTLFKGLPVEITVLDAKQLQKKGFNAHYAVGKGSNNPPYLLQIKYRYKKRSNPVVLVGKGVTFDSGGISLKPSKGMKDMKADMLGAANVLAATLAVAQLKLNTSVVTLIPLAENMPSNQSYRPGDILTAHNGKTIEITNTDAEGRLLLADALSHASTFNPKVIIDVATLTGAACVALGKCAAALFGNESSHIEWFKNIYQTTGERFWQLPLYDEYLEYLKSDSADLINCSEDRSTGGCITAAKFLEQFVGKHAWIHLDIAPVMQHSKHQGYHVKGMSGFSVRSLISFIEQT